MISRIGAENKGRAPQCSNLREERSFRNFAMPIIESRRVYSNAQHQLLALSWLKNGIISLALAGIYSIVLVVLRTPYLSILISTSEIFRSALVIHVNLSVLVWLLSMIAVIWSYICPPSYTNILLSRVALGGTIMMAISPLVGANEPIMNNYIPMLENIIFIIGLSLFGTTILFFSVGVVYQWGRSMSSKRWLGSRSLFTRDSRLLENDNIIPFNITAIATVTTALMYILVWVSFILSYFKLQAIIKIVPIDIDFYYELLYWSGGHLLQFLYTQGAMWVWLILAGSLQKKKLNLERYYLFLFYLNFILSLAALFGHFFYDIIDADFKEYYTDHMKYVGGIAPILCLMGIVYSRPFKNVVPASHSVTPALEAGIRGALICSALLFLSGGFIGILISGLNVTIPAHYHGSIVGITIAFMGIAYLFCGQHLSKFAAWPIYIITIGQILHITGLSVAGGYGVMRKTPGTELVFKAKLAMGMMGGGGLIAIIGGLMFVYICGKTLYSSSETSSDRLFWRH